MFSRRSLHLLANCLFVLTCQSVWAYASPARTASKTLRRHQKTSLATTSKDENDEDFLRGGAVQGPPLPPPPLPALEQYRKFAIPCLGLWIAGPLLSLVDTSFVGLSGSSDQSAKLLAALGPATTFFDGATYLFAFLNVATTNLYSSARAQMGEKSARAESVVRTAGNVAFRCGLGLMLFVFAFSRPLLKLYIGDEAASSPGLLDAACVYLNTRAWSIPTYLITGVLQAALLGARDSVTPLVAILYSTVVNVVGDYLLVNRFQMGLRGAAIATTAAQWASTIALIGPARRKLVQDHKLGILSKPKVEGGVTGRAFLAFAAPVLTLILGKLAAFGFMTHSAAAAPGQPTPLAAHQVILSLLFFCSPFLEVISQTAQTFLPPFVAPIMDYTASQKEKDPNFDASNDPSVQEWRGASQSAAATLMELGFSAAIVVASCASLVPAFFGNLITSDSTVQQAVKPLAKYLWLGTFFWAPVAVCEGVLLARRELKFLATVYVTSTALLPSALMRVKKRAGGVDQVWSCFVVFQVFRAACFMGRIWGGPLLQRLGGRKTKKDEGPAPSMP